MNHERLLKKPSLQENCAYAEIGGTCWNKKTFVEVFLRLEKNHYKLGETVPVHVECRIDGAVSNVKKVRGRTVINSFTISACNE